MSLLTWVSVLSVAVILCCLYLLLAVVRTHRSAFVILIGLSLVSYLVSQIIYLVDTEFNILIRWFNFTSLVIVLSSLFALIRESKPIFARFPSYLIYLPFLTLLFFPLVVDQKVITDLLSGTFQLGCVLVALFMFGINHYKERNSLLQLIGAVTLLISIIIFWFTPLEIENRTMISELLIATAGLTTSIGLKNKYITSHHIN